MLTACSALSQHKGKFQLSASIRWAFSAFAAEAAAASLIRANSSKVFYVLTFVLNMLGIRAEGHVLALK